MKKVNVAVIGMNFGKEFVKLYQKHPNVGKVAICQRSPEALRKTCLLYTSPSPRDRQKSRMPSSA